MCGRAGGQVGGHAGRRTGRRTDELADSTTDQHHRHHRPAPQTSNTDQHHSQTLGIWTPTTEAERPHRHKDNTDNIEMKICGDRSHKDTDHTYARTTLTTQTKQTT